MSIPIKLTIRHRTIEVYLDSDSLGAPDNTNAARGWSLVEAAGDWLSKKVLRGQKGKTR